MSWASLFTVFDFRFPDLGVWHFVSRPSNHNTSSVGSWERSRDFIGAALFATSSGLRNAHSSPFPPPQLPLNTQDYCRIARVFHKSDAAWQMQESSRKNHAATTGTTATTTVAAAIAAAPLDYDLLPSTLLGLVLSARGRS